MLLIDLPEFDSADKLRKMDVPMRTLISFERQSPFSRRSKIGLLFILGRGRRSFCEAGQQEGVLF